MRGDNSRGAQRAFGRRETVMVNSRLRQRSCLIVAVAVACALVSCRREAARPAAGEPATALPVVFDPARDPAQDLQLAVATAASSGKRIILDVGGEWCVWCHRLDAFLEEHAGLKEAIARDFVWLKINWSEGHENTQFLSTYPKVAGYPHLFVLDGDGTLLHSQDTALLEEGSSYNLQKVAAFLARWAPAGKRSAGGL